MGRVDMTELAAARKRWALRWVPEEEQCEVAARYAFECQRREAMALVRKVLVHPGFRSPSNGLECDTKGKYKSATTRVEWSRFLKAWMGGVEWAQQDKS